MNTQLCSFKTCIPVSCSLSTFGNVFGHTTLTFCSMFIFMFLFHVILPFYHRTTENPVSHRYKVVERNTVQSNVETELPWAISSHGVQQMSLCFPWKFEISLLAKLWVCYGTLGALAHGLGTVWYRPVLYHICFFSSSLWHFLAIPILITKVTLDPAMASSPLLHL